MQKTITVLEGSGSQFNIDEPYKKKRQIVKKDAAGLEGSILSFVSDEMYFLYSEAEQKVCEVIGTYKVLAEDKKLRNLLLQLEDLMDVITRFFYRGLDLTETAMEVFLEKFEELSEYELIPA